MKKTLISIGIWIASQIVVTLIFVIAATIAKIDIAETIAPALAISDALVILILLVMRYYKANELFQLVPGKIFLASMLLGFCSLMAVDMLAAQVDIPNMFGDMFQKMSHSIWGFFGICLIGPIMEEILMRRVILTEMSALTKSQWWGIIISAALFAVVHVNPIQVVFAMPAGIVLGWLYCKTGSLFVPICIHIMNNTISFFTLRSGKESNLELSSTLGIIILSACIIVTIAMIVWIVVFYHKKAKADAEQAQAVTVETASEY